jgi:ferrous iron transport protein B
MQSEKDPKGKIVLVGNPNVGKSVVFRLLTGSYVLVSNFPGTTVDVSRGRMTLGGTLYEVIDTPGVNSLVPQSEDERVTCEILLCEKPDVIVQVADAKNLRRTLLVTSQLAEFGRPMVLVLNMIDEAQARGIEIDTKGLAESLAVPVVETVAIYSQGKRQLLQALQNATIPTNPVSVDNPILQELRGQNGANPVPPALGVEWLSLDDRGLTGWLETSVDESALQPLRKAQELHLSRSRRSLAREIAEMRDAFLDTSVDRFKHKRQTHFLEEDSAANVRIWLRLLVAGLLVFAWNELGALLGFQNPYKFATGLARAWLDAPPEWASSGIGNFVFSLLAGRSATGKGDFGLAYAAIHFCLFIAPVVVPLAVLLSRSRRFAQELGVLSRRADTGIPILLAVMLLVYEFVGYTGAQTLVGLLEEVLFGKFLIPPLRDFLPAGIVRDFIAGQYGMVSMGITYAIAIVFPVVTTFFIAFSLLEDSGYLPRLSILSDRVMRRMGLNGKATLPMVLGLGCCTMATITTRILNSRKERLIATLLLALGIPCSAQLGVILGISASFSFGATLTVLGVVAMQLLLVGYLSSRLIKGRRSEFIFEIPPIRVPQLKNVLLKTAYRLRWYIQEAVPLFVFGTLVLFFLDRMSLGGRSLLAWIQNALTPVLTRLLYLPAQAAPVFVLGFLRRDYGAAGLFQMVRNHMLTAQQAVVSLIVITLFVPCLASFLVIVKEQGMKRALAITGFIIPFAVTVGATVSWILRTMQITFH